MSRIVSMIVSVSMLSLAASAQEPPPLAADRSVEPVVLTGAEFPQWSGGAELTARRPQAVEPTPLNPSDCADETTEWDDSGDHSCHQSPDVALYGDPARTGVAVNRLRGYRWDPVDGWIEIPFQVDERFTRYLSNNASGFAFYSGVDQHVTYAFDREPFRFVANGDADQPSIQTGASSGVTEYHSLCDSRPRDGGLVAAPDPLQGLDDNDEVVFMAADAGLERAPVGTALPPGAEEAVEVVVADPFDPSAVRYVYVMRAGDDAGPAAFDETNGYVRYGRDPDADMFVFSESSYDDYGNAPDGPHCDPETGELVTDSEGAPLIRQRRPKDTAWVRTDRYSFRYDGRWLMTELHVSPSDQGLTNADYGPDLIDRWKARAFQQDPSSETPCCGYEEEDTNWGGSSILLGEKAGPVRMIRETWGADSGTNVVRRETFYPRSVNYSYYLRVHVIPPLDGIYTQWDYNAGRMTRYYNPVVSDGVDVDGRNDEVLGNFDDPCNPRYDGRGSAIDQTYRQTYQQAPELCGSFPYHQSVDVFDPTFSMVNATLQWEQVSGPHGTIVTRWMLKDPTVIGAVQGLVAVPYYRDDSCFDDGTGTNPGPKVFLRSGDEPTETPEGTARKCWEPADGLPDEDQENSGLDPRGDPWPDGDLDFFQGSIGTHGLHLLFLAESDNASLTVPVTEINSQQWQVILPLGEPDEVVGEIYGRQFEKPLVPGTVPRPDLG